MPVRVCIDCGAETGEPRLNLEGLMCECGCDDMVTPYMFAVMGRRLLKNVAAKGKKPKPKQCIATKELMPEPVPETSSQKKPKDNSNATHIKLGTATEEPKEQPMPEPSSNKKLEDQTTLNKLRTALNKLRTATEDLKEQPMPEPSSKKKRKEMSKASINEEPEDKSKASTNKKPTGKSKGITKNDPETSQSSAAARATSPSKGKETSQSSSRKGKASEEPKGNSLRFWIENAWPSPPTPLDCPRRCCMCQDGYGNYVCQECAAGMSAANLSQSTSPHVNNYDTAASPCCKGSVSGPTSSSSSSSK
jgi:hypothetical protein